MTSLASILGFAAALSLAAPVAMADPALPADADKKVKCRHVDVTGSLVRKGKVCKTMAEWKRIQENGNRTARAILESGQVCSGGDICRGN